MNICFSGLQLPIPVDDAAVTVLEVHNKAFFARICQSLASQRGSDAIEPHTFWDEAGKEWKASNCLLVVDTPLDLPWDDRALAGGLANRMAELTHEDADVRQGVEDAFALLQSRLRQVAIMLDSEYAFEVDWELKKYLRTYGFGVELDEDEPLIDKLIKFLMLAKDASLDKAIAFVNLKLFLTKNELEQFYEQAFFAELRLLLVENVEDAITYKRERKLVIDQDFIESW